MHARRWLHAGFAAAVALALATAGLWPASAQSPSNPKYFAVTPLSESQSSVRVDTSTTPNRVEAGCETDRTGSATVNGVRLVGAATTLAPTLSTIPCTGGDTNIPFTITPAGTGTLTLGSATGNTAIAGTLSVTGATTMTSAAVTVGSLTVNTTALLPTVSTFVTFFRATEHCSADNTATPMIKTRVAANDWALARTAAGAETQNITCSFPLPWRTTSSKGARIDGFKVSHQITVVNLTSATFSKLATVTYANNVANAVADYGGVITITLPTVVQANPYLTSATVGTPAFMTTADAAVELEYQVVQANTGVYRLYGISVAWSKAPF